MDSSTLGPLGLSLFQNSSKSMLAKMQLMNEPYLLIFLANFIHMYGASSQK